MLLPNSRLIDPKRVHCVFLRPGHSGSRELRIKPGSQSEAGPFTPVPRTGELDQGTPGSALRQLC